MQKAEVVEIDKDSLSDHLSNSEHVKGDENQVNYNISTLEKNDSIEESSESSDSDSDESLILKDEETLRLQKTLQVTLSTANALFRKDEISMDKQYESADEELKASEFEPEIIKEVVQSSSSSSSVIELENTGKKSIEEVKVIQPEEEVKVLQEKEKDEEEEEKSSLETDEEEISKSSEHEEPIILPGEVIKKPEPYRNSLSEIVKKESVNKDQRKTGNADASCSKCLVF